MRPVYVYSHLGGEEILLVRYPEISSEIDEVIDSIPNPGRGKISQERTMRGKKLYSPTELNKLFDNAFEPRGWNELRDYYDIELPNYRHIVKRSYKQCDYYRPPVLVEVQFGKYAFMFYDLAKFQYFYNQALIEVGVEIVPCHFLQQEMSSGVSYGEQLVNDLERLSRNFPSVPVKIILIDMPVEGTDYGGEERQLVHQDHENYLKMIEDRLQSIQAQQ